MGPLANSCAMVMLTSTPSAGWITIDSSARRLNTNIGSYPRQRAQRSCEGLSLRSVGHRRRASENIHQLPDLVLPHMNDVAIHLIRGAAAGHQLHQCAPALGDYAAGLGRVRIAGVAGDVEAGLRA